MMVQDQTTSGKNYYIVFGQFLIDFKKKKKKSGQIWPCHEVGSIVKPIELLKLFCFV